MQNKKNLPIHIFIYVAVVMLQTACQQNSEILVEPAFPSFEKNEYNKDLNEFTLAVREAYVNSSEFRKVLKSEVLKKADGDYNVLLSHIIPPSLWERKFCIK